MVEGGCRCGAVRYRVEGDAAHHALCHCRDCQMASGAPMVAWSAFPASGFSVTKGEARVFNGAGASYRHFCGDCGTPLWFRNEEALPGIVDIHTVTLDEPDACAPQVQIQMAERRPWMDGAHALPAFDRFPG